MKKEKGITTVEILVIITIALALAGIIGGSIMGVNRGDYSDATEFVVDPVRDNAVSQRRIANELKRQNDLMERQLEIQESQQRR